jgi:hypothetical protein
LDFGTWTSGIVLGFGFGFGTCAWTAGLRRVGAGAAGMKLKDFSLVCLWEMGLPEVDKWLLFIFFKLIIGMTCAPDASCYWP